ncbi:MAG: hypothetical protein ABIJ46_03880 [bacterium]
MNPTADHRNRWWLEFRAWLSSCTLTFGQSVILEIDAEQGDGPCGYRTTPVKEKEVVTTTVRAEEDGSGLKRSMTSFLRWTMVILSIAAIPLIVFIFLIHR